MESEVVIDTMRTAARLLQSGSDAEVLRAAQAAQDALDAVKAECLSRMAETREHEVDGASSPATWARLQLRLTPKETSALVHAGDTFRRLPAVADAAARGEVRLAHVSAFTYGLKHVGDEIVSDNQDALLDAAKVCDPNEVFRLVRSLREAVYPEELDKAWAEGMDKTDIRVDAVPDGWHVTGFLDSLTGAKFRTVLDSLGAPRDADDTRPGSERRVTALGQLLDSVLQHGLPSDKGIRPQLMVTVDGAMLDQALQHRAGLTKPPTGEPAHLAEFGAIGPAQLGYLGCLSDLVPVVTDGNGQVLDVGRTRRLATPKQRRAVLLRQQGRCAAPGCSNTHLEIHHAIWWSRGGSTDLDQLVGLCTRCHHLVHRGLLMVTPTGDGTFTFGDQWQHLFSRRHDPGAPPPVLRRTRRPHARHRPLRT